MTARGLCLLLIFGLWAFAWVSGQTNSPTLYTKDVAADEGNWDIIATLTDVRTNRLALYTVKNYIT